MKKPKESRLNHAGSTQPKRKFAGLLAKPIQMPRQPLPRGITVLDDESEHARIKADSDEALQQNAKDAAGKAAKKMPVLLAHYDISPNGAECWYALALRLAMDFVPGFRVVSPGLHKTWTLDQLAHLYYDIERTRHYLDVNGTRTERKRPLSTMSACEHLQKSVEPWKGTRAKTLANRYLEAQASPLVVLVRQFPRDQVVQRLAELVKILRKPSR